jgi:hypothetical protein
MAPNSPWAVSRSCGKRRPPPKASLPGRPRTLFPLCLFDQLMQDYGVNDLPLQDLSARRSNEPARSEAAIVEDTDVGEEETSCT